MDYSEWLNDQNCMNTWKEIYRGHLKLELNINSTSIHNDAAL